MIFEQMFLFWFWSRLPSYAQAQQRPSTNKSHGAGRGERFFLRNATNKKGPKFSFI